MPITTRSRQQPPTAAAVASTTTKAVKKNVKATKTSEKAPMVNPEEPPSDDDIPLASVKARATAKTKAPAVTKAAPKRATKAVSEVPPKLPVDETFVVNKDELDTLSNEEPDDLPEHKSVVIKKFIKSNSATDENETEKLSDNESKPKVEQKKRLPAVKSIKAPKLKFTELDVEESPPNTVNLKGAQEPVSRDEIKDILSETIIIEPKPVKKAQKGKPAAPKKTLPVRTHEESEDDENSNDAAETNLLKKSAKEQAEHEDSDSSEELNVVNSQKKIPVIEDSESEFDQTDSGDPCSLEESDEEFEPETKATQKRAIKKGTKDKPLENGAVTKSRKPPRKAASKKAPNVAEVDGLLGMIKDLTLDSKKGPKKKAAAKAKPKVTGKKVKKPKQVDSEPETGTLTKYSSTESLRNVTIRGRSQSVDNLNLTATPATLQQKPKRVLSKAPIAKVLNAEQEAVESAPAKNKTRAPRKKAAK
nr:PREDICTED: uncharacterized protein LOC109034303 [Bemisia tabaci]